MHHHFSNKELANILFEMSALYEMQDVPYKPRAYDRAAHSIESLDEEVEDLYRKGGEPALDGIKGVGEAIAAHLRELFTKGSFEEYDSMRAAVPVDILGLTAIEGVGPKMVQTLWQKLQIKNLAELEEAAKAGRLAALPRFGKRSEARILKNIALYRAAHTRFPLETILPKAERLEKAIRAFPEVKRVAVAGSIRRHKTTIGDIDILAVSDNPERVMDRFIALPEVAHVYDTGPTKTNVRLSYGIDADLRVVPEESWGAALCYFTGSKAHSIALRNIALEQGLKLNEYGLFKGEKNIASEKEEDIYQALGLPYVKPEDRETADTIER